MERITLLLLMVVPHTSTIPLEDFYPFGEAVGDGYLIGINQREGVYYIESVFFGHTNQRVGTYSFQHRLFCLSILCLRVLIDSYKFSGIIVRRCFQVTTRSRKPRAPAPWRPERSEGATPGARGFLLRVVTMEASSNYFRVSVPVSFSLVKEWSFRKCTISMV